MGDGDGPREAQMQSSFGLTHRMRAGLVAPAEAREAVLGLPVLEHLRERLALVVSELVTNSVRHAGLAAGDPIDLHMISDDGRMRISVRDGGPGFDPQTVAGREGAGGFGLTIIAAVARDWGVMHDDDGFTVWCALEA